MKQQISLGEHMIRTQMFMQSLSDKMPEISNTITTLMKIKKQREMKQKWNPAEGIEDEESMQEFPDNPLEGGTY